MIVSDVFRSLSFGVLSNLSIGKEGEGDIEDKRKGKIIDYINAGLLRLYSRFLLNEKEVMLLMVEGITNYYLQSRFAQSKCDPVSTDPAYIADLLNPFQDDVIKVLEVRDNKGNELPLNDTEDRLSVFTPRPDLIQVPKSYCGLALGVNYQARHKKIEYGVLTANIYLPDVLHEAFFAYIGHRVYSDMNGQENIGKGQELLAMYESLCNDAIQQDLVSTAVSTTNTNFKRRGFI